MRFQGSFREVIFSSGDTGSMAGVPLEFLTSLKLAPKVFSIRSSHKISDGGPERNVFLEVIMCK